MTLVRLTLCAIVLLGSACAVRDAAMYRDDTRKLLEGKDPALRECYDAELQKDPKAAGKVIVNFTVQKDTGAVVDPKVDDLQKEAEQDGLARASRPGECDYFQKNPEAAEALRKAAREAKEASLKH